MCAADFGWGLGALMLLKAGASADATKGDSFKAQFWAEGATQEVQGAPTALQCAQVAELLRQYSSPQPDVLPEIIAHAADQGDYNTVTWWLHLPGQHVDALMQGDDHWKSLLMTASLAGQLRVVEMLLARSAAVDVRTSKYGCTSLMAAAHMGWPAIVSALLDARANPSLRSKQGGLALDNAQAKADVSGIMLKLLKEQGRDHRQVAEMKEEVVRILLAQR
eukprot:6383992-Prymnesium_polylepis.2